MFIISELSGQYGGDLRRAEQMILASKLAGANAVKVQLYDTYKMPGDNRERWEYLSIKYHELRHLKDFSDKLNIEIFASVFDEERLEWCEKLGFKTFKIASFVLKELPQLAEKIIAKGIKNRTVLVSLGMYDWKSLGKPFKGKNIKYLYCVSKYPATLEDIAMPDFNDSIFDGYSDHSPGITAAIYAISKGAKILEKHFTTSKALQKETEKAHACSMDMDDLRLIRNFSDEFNIISTKI